MTRGALVLLMGAVCAGAGQAQEGANLLVNGGFELAMEGADVPDGWTFTADAADPKVKGCLATGARSGRYAFCVENGLGKRRTTLSSPSFALKPNTAYEVSVWLRMDGPSPQDGVMLRVGTNAGSQSVELQAGHRWRKSTFTFWTEPDAESGNVHFAQPGGLAEKLYIDDVEVREKKIQDIRPPIHKTDLARFKFPRARPRLEHTAAELEAMKREMAGRDIREHDWVRRAEAALGQQVHFFEEGYDFRKYYNIGRSCHDDGSSLRPVVHPDGSEEMHCPKCGRVYRGEAQRACARALFNGQMAVAAQTLARGYALTGDERYARKTAEILRGFAAHYKAWGGGGHAVLYQLRESYGFLLPCTKAYDYIYDSPALSEEDHRRIEEDFFRVAGEYYCKHADTNGRMNNRGAIHNSSVMSIGAVINDKEFVDHALNSPYSGFHALAARIFDGDGLAWEGFGYHTYTVSGLSPIAEMAHRIGLNVYDDPAYRRIFEAPLKLLLPGEEAMPDAYRTVCRRFAEMGQPMAYPFDEKEMAAPVPSFNFRSFGYGVLRSGEGENRMYLSMEYGKETMFMGHAPAPKFSLVFYANGQTLTPKGAAGYGTALCGSWSRRAGSHNTVVVDEKDQWGRTPGKFIAFETAPRVQVMRASDDETYGGITLDRTLFLTDGYAVDLSGAFAESGQHRYDFCYRNYGALSCGLPFRDRKGPVGAGQGFQHLTDARSARTGDTWQADWRQSEESALRVTVLGGAETEVLACASPDNTDEEKGVDAVVARRWGEGTVFASVWEPHRKQPSVSRVERLPVQSAGSGAGDREGIGVQVIRDGRPGAECFLAAYAPGMKTFGDIELDGKIAAGRWRDAQAAPDYLHLVKGVLLKRGDHSLEANAPATLYVEQLSPDRLLVKPGSESAGTLTLAGRLPGAVTVTRDGQPVAAKVAQEKTLTFEVAQDASYEVAGVAGWQSIRLLREGAAEVEEALQGEVALAAAAAAPQPGVQAALAPDGSLAGKNKLPNGGFEANEKTAAGTVSPWEFRSSYYLAKFRADCEVDGEAAHSGKHSLKIVNTNWYAEVSQDAWAVQKVPGSWANKTVTLSAWVKSSLAPTRVRLCVYGFSPGWGYDYEGGVSPKLDVGTEWQRITWTRTFGPDVTDVYVMIKREHQVLGGDVWVDDVQLEEGTQATDFAPDAWTAAALKER